MLNGFKSMFSFSSGSSGNVTYIGTDRTNVLVDAGLPAKYIIKALKDINVSPCELDAILVSHEHTDHIKGSRCIIQKIQYPNIRKRTYMGRL